jgi:hypothetical protein
MVKNKKTKVMLISSSETLVKDIKEVTFALET